MTRSIILVLRKRPCRASPHRTAVPKSSREWDDILTLRDESVLVQTGGVPARHICAASAHKLPNGSLAYVLGLKGVPTIFCGRCFFYLTLESDPDGHTSAAALTPHPRACALPQDGERNECVLFWRVRRWRGRQIMPNGGALGHSEAMQEPQLLLTSVTLHCRGAGRYRARVYRIFLCSARLPPSHGM